jgi:molybdenum cofactor cytidylyltransferase
MSPNNWSPVQAFGLGAAGQLVAITGGGGKSSLMFVLAQQLPGRVIMTTTTRIFASQMERAPAALLIEDREPEQWPELDRCLAAHGRCLVAGRVNGDKAGGVAPDVPGRFLARPDIDYVLVEADGSRMRPVKAPAEHEPVIPPESTLVVPAVGMDALDGPIEQVAHRPELVATLTGIQPHDRLAPEPLAWLVTHPDGVLKGIPEQARIIPLLNKVENEEQLIAARQTAHDILKSGRIEQVVLGALRTAQPVVEVQRRVTAVVLAAGEAKRMGQTKQLLPWGETTVLGQTLANLSASLVHDVVVVTGHERQAVARIAVGYGAAVVHNPAYASGEMLSSLQAAVRFLPARCSAVLVVLADQPMLAPETINSLLAAYWQGRGTLVAPTHDGRRGNPVLIDRAHFAELLALPPGAAPRALLKSRPESLYLTSADDPAVLRDLDRPEDYKRWRPE